MILPRNKDKPASTPNGKSPSTSRNKTLSSNNAPSSDVPSISNININSESPDFLDKLSTMRKKA